MNPAPTTISATIDLDAPGKQVGHLTLPYSRDDAAYGAVMIPIASIGAGSGPTVLLTGGSHGDEFQGPTSLIKLANTLQPDQITGRVIIVPAMNHPAFLAGTRTSPIDAGNLNRLFPGRADGTHTERIADYLSHHLLPRADFVADIHDGGKTLEFVPTVSSPVFGDAALTGESRSAALAFGAPYVTQLVEIDTLGMWDFVVGDAGCPFVNTEIGGTGGTRPHLVEIVDRGLHNLLVHWGLLAGDPIEAPQSVSYTVPATGGYITSEHDGLLEWLVDLGEPIQAGEPIARVHDAKRLGVPAVDYSATIDGMLAMRHHQGLVKMGDAIAMQATLD